MATLNFKSKSYADAVDDISIDVILYLMDKPYTTVQ